MPQDEPSSIRRISFAALLMFAASAPLQALEFECSLPGDTRFVRVDIPGEDHLCEVSVTGESGAGERRVLWYADNETLFCSAKAYELRDKYVEEFGFDCAPWPDRDGIDRLSARQRSIVDRQLKSLLENAVKDEPGSVVEGVRATASTPLDGNAGMLALQFFLSDGSDRVRVVADELETSTVLADVGDLAAQIDPIDGFAVSGAFVDSISESGALDVVTLLSPENAAARDGAAAPCEGRQTLRVGDGGTLVPDTSHRHVCIDAVPDAG